MAALSVEDIEAQFATAVASSGFGEHSFPADGAWHHFSFPDSSNGKKNGSAKLSYGESPEGVVIDRRKGKSPCMTWRPTNGSSGLTDTEREHHAAVENERAKKVEAARQAAKLKAQDDFHNAQEATPDHPYLKKKGIKQPDPLRVDKGKLLVPIYDALTGEFQTIQRISADGTKRFPTNGTKTNGCAMPSSIRLNDLKKLKPRGSPIIIAEGYATADAIRRSTFYPTLAAMDCGNLENVAKIIRQRFPLHKIIIAADNDTKTEGNPGVRDAAAAARAIGAKIAIPPPGDFSDLCCAEGEDAVADAIKNAQEPPPAPEPTPAKGGETRPVIQVNAGELSTVADRAQAVLLEANVKIYQRAGTLVRPIVEIVEASHGRKTKVAQLARIDPTYLRDLLARIADWTKFDGRSKKLTPTNPPSETASTILARVGEWDFPAIAGVITTPTMRPDGTILDQPGYDPETRLLLIEPPPMPHIAARPSRADAVAALQLLEDLLFEFPLADEVANAVALSALITPVVRGAFPVTPMHVARAPVAASGKSYLFDIVAAIAIGQPMPVMAAGREEAETEKRLGAALLTGQPLISIDNLNGELFGDALCQIIERPVVEVRILQKSERVRIEARGTSIFATGNNIVLVGDVCRRSLTATLDPQLERPELRAFKGDPVATVLADRGAYIAAALTICRAYVAAGRPKLAPRLASFEGWSDTVRSALMWLGKADPVASMELARAEDPELGALREVLTAWAETIGVGYSQRISLQDVIALTKETEGLANGSSKPKYPDLQSAVQAVAGRRGAPDAKSLGVWARSRKDRIVDDLRLTNKPDPRGASEWWVEPKDGAQKKGKRPVAVPF